MTADTLTQERAVQRNSGTWMGFLAMTFVVVGLAGLFATFAAPLPYQRAVRRDAALDEALATANRPDQASLLASMRPQLDTSAAVVIDGTGDLAGRVSAARQSMHAEMQHEADAIANRLVLLLLVVTSVSATFGVVIIGAASRTQH